MFSSVPLTLVYKIDIHTSTVSDWGGIDQDIRIAVLGQTERHVGQVPVASASGKRDSDAASSQQSPNF